jgi:hypothetical protein
MANRSNGSVWTDSRIGRDAVTCTKTRPNAATEFLMVLQPTGTNSVQMCHAAALGLVAAAVMMIAEDIVHFPSQLSSLLCVAQ